MNNEVKVIAYYLPQYHRTKENDEWWGVGFTEWTNVAMARPLFKGHYQPKIPSELGFYDLRFPAVRQEQADMARNAGISAFCYWHYWMGNGKKLLSLPLEDVLRTKQPRFPFCLAWANHSWYKKQWFTDYKHWANPKSQILLAEQLYPGIEDIDEHFYSLLDAFRDERYFKINGKNVFVIYSPLTMPNWVEFRDRWQFLAKCNGLPEFYFIAHTLKSEEIERIKLLDYDAINLTTHRDAFPSRNKTDSDLKKIILFLTKRIRMKPQIVEYAKAIELMKNDAFRECKIYPTIVPNWDHTPRSGYFGTCFHNSNPELFEKHVKYLLDTIKDKNDEDKILFIKSWNEWGEGNYMEPDIKYGDEYLKTLKKCLE